MAFVLTKAKNESTSCRYNNKNIHSAYDPEKEALMFIEKGGFNLDKNIFVLVFPGLNYIGKILSEKGKKVITVYSDIFFSNNSVFSPADSILSDGNIYSFLKQRISLYEVSDTEVIFNTGICSLFRDMAETVNSAIKAFLNEAISSRTTIFRFGRKWIKNCLLNIRDNNPCGFDIEIDKPVLLLGSGPSVEKTREYREIINEKFTIFTFSSAASILDCLGIKYDYVFHTDPGHYSSYYLYGIKKSDKKLISPLTADAGLFSRYSVFPLNTSMLIESFFYEKSGINSIKIFDNGSVATSAVSFLIKHNVKKIFTSGLDFLYYDIKSHGKGHYHYNLFRSWSKKTMTENTILYRKRADIVPEKYGNYYTGPSLNAYCSWFKNENRGYIYNLIDEHPRKVFPRVDIETAVGYSQDKVIISSGKKNTIENRAIVKEYLDIIQNNINQINSENLNSRDFLENTLTGEFLSHYCSGIIEKYITGETGNINTIKELAEEEIKTIINRIL